MPGDATIAWVGNIQNTVYATWNPADKAANVALSGGDLTTTRTGAGPAGVRATIGKSSGKHQFEVKCISTTGGTFDIWVGLANLTHSLTTLPGQGNAHGWAIAIDGGDYYHNGFIALVNGGVGFAAVANDVFTFVWDAGANTLGVKRNGTFVTPNPLFSDLSGTLYPVITCQDQSTVMTANFGATALVHPEGGYNLGLYN